jgi:hypothetical protein
MPLQGGTAPAQREAGAGAGRAVSNQNREPAERSPGWGWDAGQADASDYRSTML